MTVGRSAQQTTAAVHEQDALIAELTQTNAKLTADLAVVQGELNKVRSAALQERSVCIEMCRNVDAEQAKLATAQAKLAADQAKLAADQAKLQHDKRELASLMKELDRSIAAQQQRDADLHRLKKELAAERQELAAERQQRHVDRAFEDELGKLNDALETRVKELEASLAIAQLPAPTPVAAPAPAPAPPVAAAPKLVIPTGVDRRKSIGVAVGTKMAADQLEALAELENMMTPSRPMRSGSSTAAKAPASRLRLPTATPKRPVKK